LAREPQASNFVYETRMNYLSGPGRAIQKTFMRLGASLGIAVEIAVLVLSAGSAAPQPLDCSRLAAEISAFGDNGQKPSNHYGGATQKQRAELNRAIRNARALGCDRSQFFLFDTAPPQCPSLNAQIQHMQASLAQYGGAGDLGGNSTARQQLIARYNAYCRGQVLTSPQPRQRGFFETLFGALAPNANPFNQPPQIVEVPPLAPEDATPHGGSQALCVRTCDGGFFPLNLSVRQSDPDQLAGLCQALCPNSEVSVYTRSPNQDISTAAALDGQTSYSELPNALKFEKSFDPACTCKPPGKSWAEALSGAEELLGRARKTDVMVTPETSAELAKPALQRQPPPGQSAQPLPGRESNAGNNAAPAGQQTETGEVTGPDGVKRHVRIIVPPL
jgi:hypothetical protein